MVIINKTNGKLYINQCSKRYRNFMIDLINNDLGLGRPGSERSCVVCVSHPHHAIERGAIYCIIRRVIELRYLLDVAVIEA